METASRSIGLRTVGGGRTIRYDIIIYYNKLNNNIIIKLVTISGGSV